MADDKLTPEEQLAKQQAIAEAAARRLASLEESTALMKEELKHATELSNKVELAAGIRQNEIKLFESRIEKMQASLGIQEAINAEVDKQTAYQQALIIGDEEKIRLAKDDLILAQEHLSTLYAQIEANKEDLKIMKKRAKAVLAAEQGTKKTLEAMTGVSEAWRDTTWGALATTMDDADSFSEALMGMENAFNETFTTANMLGSTIEKMIESSIATAMALDEQTAAVGRATGQGRRYDKMITDMTYSFSLAGNSMRQLGVSTQEYAESLVSLNSTVAAFSKQNAGAQKNMVEFTATMQKLGIQNAAVSETYDTLVGAFRMSSAEAEAAIGDVLSLAMEMGIPPQQMAEEFNVASKRLAAYGSGMISVFKKVSASAKALNMDTTTLLNIMEQFDTFEGAANAVGNLNAVLGGPYLNSIQMVRMNEEQRTRAMLEAMEASNKSWKDMGKYEKMAIANAAGIDDMAEANKIFGQSLSSYDEQMEKAAEADEKQKDFNEAVKELQTLGDKLKIMFQSLAISLKPVFKALGNVLDVISHVFSIFTGILSWNDVLTTAILGIAAAFVIFKIATLAATSPLQAFMLAFVLLSSLSPTLGKALLVVGAAWGIYSIAQNAALLPLLAIVVAIAAAIAAFYGFYKLIGFLANNISGIFTSILSGFKAFTMGLIRGLVKAVLFIVSMPIRLLNLIIKGMNKIPFVSIPTIPVPTIDDLPGFEKGVSNFEGGAAIVGERGPEMITMGQGSNVITNENVQKVMGAASDVASGPSGGVTIDQIKAAFVAAIQETGLASGTPADDAGGKTIIMKLNDREFGRAVYEKMEQKTNVIPK